MAGVITSLSKITAGIVRIVKSFYKSVQVHFNFNVGQKCRLYILTKSVQVHVHDD